MDFTNASAIARVPQARRREQRRAGGSSAPIVCGCCRARKTTAPGAVAEFCHSGGGIWTHFPDRVTYRFTEVLRLEPT